MKSTSDVLKSVQYYLEDYDADGYCHTCNGNGKHTDKCDYAATRVEFTDYIRRVEESLRRIEELDKERLVILDVLYK